VSLPPFVRVWCIRRLARLTADAFEMPAPRIEGPWAAALDAYAAYTAAQAARVLRSGAPLEDTRARLFSNARELGTRLRTGLRVRSLRRAASLMRALYKVIGVQFRTTRGGFTVSRCYFASRYSPEVCRLISSLDAGLFAGLSGGGGLQFIMRITEGAPFCGGTLRAGEIQGEAG
jgi:hypothetical protein